MIKITCVVDNNAKENTGLRSEHGLSFWIETEDGVLIFDTGQTAAALALNLGLLNLNIQDADTLALSHAHYDHTGGLEFILSQKKNLKIYAHSDLFQPRYSFREGEYRSIGIRLTQEELSQRAELHLSDSPQEIFPNLWTTGEISPRPEAEGRSPHHFIRVNGEWQPDPYLDDLSLVLKTPKGLILICGCCHAGLLNTLLHVQKKFSGPIISIFGGTHLRATSEAELRQVAERLETRHPNVELYLNHCTGKEAQAFLANLFGERVKAFPAGATLEI